MHCECNKGKDISASGTVIGFLKSAIGQVPRGLTFQVKRTNLLGIPIPQSLGGDPPAADANIHTFPPGIGRCVSDFPPGNAAELQKI